MIEIKGSPFYTHSLQADFKFDFGTVRLSVAFFDEWVYVVLPDDKELLWKIVKVERELLVFLQRIRQETEKLQFIIRFGTQGDCKDEQKVLRPDLATTMVVNTDGPATSSSTPYSLPFGAR